jgi:hypothetical protein
MKKKQIINKESFDIKLGVGACLNVFINWNALAR